MREVNVTDLRAHLPAFLASVQAGEEVLVTSRGKVIARLVLGFQVGSQGSAAGASPEVHDRRCGLADRGNVGSAS